MPRHLIGRGGNSDSRCRWKERPSKRAGPGRCSSISASGTNSSGFPGTSTLKIICLSGYEPWRRFEADYRAGNKAAYQREKDRWTDILIRRTEERLIPGLSSIIEVKEAGTPLTCWRYTGNTDGAIYGFEQPMDNAFMNRIDNRTPVKGLYLASAWGNPGGGFGGVLRGGQQAFEKIVDDWN